jgi:hypothetical protein
MLFLLTVLPLLKNNRPPDAKMAFSLLCFLAMGWICQHCDAPFVGPPYRVTSEESGIVLLDLIVCHRCHVQARELGLRTEKIDVQSYLVTGMPVGDERKA